MNALVRMTRANGQYAIIACRLQVRLGKPQNEYILSAAIESGPMRNRDPHDDPPAKRRLQPYRGAPVTTLGNIRSRGVRHLLRAPIVSPRAWRRISAAPSRG
jgi:hypothetical protein